MSRPMLLIQESLLSDIWYRHTCGVPILTLIKQEQLSITAPTLTKLLKYVTNLESINLENELNIILYNIIYNSLFPKWLEEFESNIVKQPNKYKYEGQFPLGQWINKEELTNENL